MVTNSLPFHWSMSDIDHLLIHLICLFYLTNTLFWILCSSICVPSSIGIVLFRLIHLVWSNWILFFLFLLLLLSWLIQPYYYYLYPISLSSSTWMIEHPWICCISLHLFHLYHHWINHYLYYISPLLLWWFLVSLPLLIWVVGHSPIIQYIYHIYLYYIWYLHSIDWLSICVHWSHQSIFDVVHQIRLT